MNFIKKSLLFLSLLSVSVVAAPVDDYGQLGVGTSGATEGRLVDATGKAVQLRGMSLFWNNYDNAKYWKAGVVTNMAEDWNMNIVRVAMGAADKNSGGTEGTYFYSGASDIDQVSMIVDEAIKAGIYVIIDWHGHFASNHKADAKSFFGTMAQKYGAYPNVIYEIWNEPLGNVASTWKSEIKPFAEEVLAEIRKYDSDNIVIVGTGNYSQRVDQVVGNRINDANVMYTVHVYAASHTSDTWFKGLLQTAVQDKLPMFMTEWGTCLNTGGGSFSQSDSDYWINWMNTNGVSWCNWSLHDKSEAASALKSGSSTDGVWTTSDLTASGTYIFNKMKTENPTYTPPGKSDNKPVISSDDAILINVGETYTIKYSATDIEDGDLTSSVTKSGTVNTSKAGVYTVTLSVTDKDNNTTTKDVKVTVTDGITPVGYVVLDDFENSMNDDNNQTYLGARFNTIDYDSAGYWYAFDDSKEPTPGTSKATPDYVKDTEFTTLQTADVNGGNQSLKVAITLGTAIDANETAFYGIGCNLTLNGNYTDMSDMTALTFYAKGSGTLKAVFMTKEAEVDFADDWGNYEMTFTLKSSWTKHTLLASDFEPSTYSDLAKTGAGFDGASDKQVSKLQFQTVGVAGDAFVFNIDDIVIEGMDYTDFAWGSHVVNDGTPITATNVPVITAPISVVVDLNSSFSVSNNITYSATDVEDGNVTSSVTSTDNVDTSKEGDYEVTLSVTDKDGNKVTKTVAVKVVDPNSDTPPVLTVPKAMTIDFGSTFNPKTTVLYSATDNEDGDITDKVTSSGDVNTSIAGKYSVVYSVTDKDGNSVSSTIVVTVKEEVTEQGFVVIDDFENSMNDKDGQTYLGARFNHYKSATDNFYGAGYWFAYDDSKSKGTSSCTPDFVKNEFEGNLSSAAYEGDTCLYAKVKLGTSVDEWGTAFYGMGFNLTEEGEYSDLSKMTSFEFYAKGSGTIRVKFKSKATASYDWGHMSYSFKLTSAWTKYSITPADIAPRATSPVDEDGLGWDDCKAAIDQILFENDGATMGEGDAYTLYLDNIKMYGMEYSDFAWGTHVDNKGKIPGAGAPTVEDIAVETNEDTKVSITLLGSDSDGVISNYNEVKAPKNGTLTIVGAVATYTPNENYYGEDVFTYTATDNEDLVSGAKTVTITVKSVNDQDPVTEDLELTLNKNTTDNVFLKATDDGDVTFKIVTQPSNGTIVVKGNSVIYTPKVGYYGPDELTYSATDNDGAVSNVSKVSITVIKINDVPIADEVIRTVKEDESVAITLSARDKDGTIESYSVDTQPKNGTVEITDSVATYTPNADFFGEDEFTYYAVDDSSAHSSSVAVTITVLSVNDGAPTAKAPANAEVENDDKLSLTLAGTDVNEFESVTSAVVVDKPENGTLKIVGLRATYTPNEGYEGTDSFTFKVVDNDGLESDEVATVTVNVIPPASILDYTPSSQFNSENLVVGPMPIKDISNIFFKVDKKGKYTFDLYTIQERKIGSFTVDAVKGENKSNWDLLNLVDGGVYYIALKKSGKMIALTRIVKTEK